MAKKKIAIHWTFTAKHQFSEIIKYVNEESPIGAEIVFESIISAIEELSSNPLRYPSDNLKANNDGSYRSFQIFSYRITYRVAKSGIYIYRIRHSSREPLSH